jgi:flagellar biosynthesis repressor protein FlbT
MISKGSSVNLVLELRQGEVMIVNGAPIRFRTKSRIELTARARFLFGKQIMAPDQADSPARRIYFALQTAYIGSDDERDGGLVVARQLIEEFGAATTSALAREILARALTLAQSDECYQALKLVRRIISHEDAVLGRKPPPQPEGHEADTGHRYGSRPPRPAGMAPAGMTPVPAPPGAVVEASRTASLLHTANEVP